MASPLARRVLADPGAVTQPDGARPQDTAQLTRSRWVHPVTRAQRKVLVIASRVACSAHGTAPRALRPATANAPAGAVTDAGNGEPVVRVWPGSGLRRVVASRADPLGQLSQLVPAPLADGRERRRVSGEAQSDLVGPPGAVMAAHGLDGQHGAIDAA